MRMRLPTNWAWRNSRLWACPAGDRGRWLPPRFPAAGWSASGIASGVVPFQQVPGALDELDDNDRAALALLPGDPAAAASAFAAGFEPLAELSRMPGNAGIVSAFEGALSSRDP